MAVQKLFFCQIKHPLSSADKFFTLMLNSGILTRILPYKSNGNEETKLYVEGVRFPDKDFNGLISINLSLLEPSSEVRHGMMRPTVVLCMILITVCLTAWGS